MDYTLVALVALIALTTLISIRQQRAARSTRYPYQRVITCAFLGLWLTISGAIGSDISHMHGFFQGAKWAGHVIWWQFAVGVVLLGVAVMMARVIPAEPPPTS